MTDSNPIIDVEIWKDIPGYSGYQASTLGRIRSFWMHRKHYLVTTPHILKTWNRTGYRAIELCVEKKRNLLAVHCLVLLAFVGPPPKSMECLHCDGNKINNKLTNLRYGTRSENLYDSVRHGTHVNLKGSENPSSKLSEDQVVSMRSLNSKGFSTKYLVEKFKTCKSNVRMIVTRKSWKHI